MEKVVVWYSIRNYGDGSAGLSWFLTKEQALKDQARMLEPWSEDCYGSVETFIGSKIHVDASAKLIKD